MSLNKQWITYLALLAVAILLMGCGAAEPEYGHEADAPDQSYEPVEDPPAEAEPSFDDQLAARRDGEPSIGSEQEAGQQPATPRSKNGTADITPTPTSLPIDQARGPGEAAESSNNMPLMILGAIVTILAIALAANTNRRYQ